MTGPSIEVQLATLDLQQKDLAKHSQENAAEIQKLKDERTHALKWGIITLGMAVLAMGKWIFSLVSTRIGI